ncbi:MAG: DUF362 domain-containing protein [Synergistaceae bacterium]|jgi:uncharacterized protein (DUF362 family)|nr:DUF362 domain-containing protein [Synergistaceae bacterium]
MERREFLKKSLALGIGAGALFLPRGLARAADLPDLVALKGPSPAAMFDRGMKALGGMERFVRPGQTVALKPNISWDVDAQGAANTQPELVARIVEHCLAAGAKRVYVFDHSIEYWESSLDASGIGAAIKASGGLYAPADEAGYYQRVDIKGSTLGAAQVHETLMESDVFIDAPVLKHHGGAGVSIAMKNLMGCVWDRRAYHARGLQACVADFLRVRRPDLCVVDAYRVITRHGPRGGSPNDVAEMRAQIISPDIVAADTAATKMLGRDPAGVEHITLAAKAGFGEMDLAKLKIERIVL